MISVFANGTEDKDLKITLHGYDIELVTGFMGLRLIDSLNATQGGLLFVCTNLTAYMRYSKKDDNKTTIDKMIQFTSR